MIAFFDCLFRLCSPFEFATLQLSRFGLPTVSLDWTSRETDSQVLRYHLAIPCQSLHLA